MVELDGTDPPEVGYRINRSELRAPDPGLEPDEAAALQLAVSLVRLEGTVGGEDLWKIGGAPRAGGRGDGRCRPPRRPDARGPVRGRRRAAGHDLRLPGRGPGGRTPPTPVRPGRWYLMARDRGAGGRARVPPRSHRRRPEVGPTHGFVAPPPDDLAGGSRPLAAHRQPPVRRPGRRRRPPGRRRPAHAGRAAVVDEDDACTAFELDVTHVDGFRSFVLGFLEHAEVLDPPELRDDVVEWLEAMV